MSSSLVLVIRLIHLIALALAVGAATVKNVLLFRCRNSPEAASTFLRVEGPITRQIVLGQVLLTLSGISYALLLGYGFTPRLSLKVALLAGLWVLGPVIDHVVAPRFKRAVPAAGALATPEFTRALNRYLFWDLTANGVFYAILVLWLTME